MSKGLGKNQRKILLLLLGGLALGCSRSPGRSVRIIKDIAKEWKKIDRQELLRSIHRLRKSKLIREETEEGGRMKLVLTKEGKEKALSFQLFEIKIKIPERWDKKWRITMFDIPENRKNKREIFRFHLKQLGFFELQKSVFIHPYDCHDEIEYIVEYYDLRRYVRYIIANFIDVNLLLKEHFKIK